MKKKLFSQIMLTASVFVSLTSKVYAISKEQTLETLVTCTEENTDYSFKQVGIVVPDGPMPFGLVVEVNEDDGLSRNVEKGVFNSLRVTKVDSTTTRYSDKYESFDLKTKRLPSGKLKGTFWREIDGPGSYFFENMNCKENSEIKILIP